MVAEACTPPENPVFQGGCLKIEISFEQGVSSSTPNKIFEEKKIKDIKDIKNKLSNDSEIKEFLDEFDAEIEEVSKTKNQK